MNVTARVKAAADRPDLWAGFRKMPVVLQTYACFVLLMIGFWGLALAVGFWPAANHLIASWTGATLFIWYLPTFNMLLIWINPTQNRRRRLIVGSLCGLLVGSLATGIIDTRDGLSDVRVTRAAQTANPSFQYSPLRPVFYVVVPTFWILMLLSPQIWRWWSEKGDGPVSVAIADLLYWVFVTAACTALSIALVGHARHRLDVGKTYAEALARMRASQQAIPSPTKTP